MLLPILLLACTPTTPSPWSLIKEEPGKAVFVNANLPEAIELSATFGRLDRGAFVEPTHLALLGLDQPIAQAAITPGTWFRTHGDRLQQGFELPTRPAGVGPLAIDVILGLDGEPHRTEHGVTFLDGRRVVATYNHLDAWDARGRTLPSEMQLRCDDDDACTVRLSVDDEGAAYPVTVDPYLTLGSLPTGVNKLPETYRNKVVFESNASGKHLFDATEDVPVPIFELDAGDVASELAWNDVSLVITDDDEVLLHRFDVTAGTYVFEGTLDGIGEPVDSARSVEIGPMGLLVQNLEDSDVSQVQLFSDASGSWEAVASAVFAYELEPAGSTLDMWIGRDRWVGESSILVPKEQGDGLFRLVVDGDTLVMDAEWTVDPGYTGTYRLPAFTDDGVAIWGGFYNAAVVDGLGDPEDPASQRDLPKVTLFGSQLIPSPSGRWLVDSVGFIFDPYAPIGGVPLLRMGSDLNVALYYMRPCPYLTMRPVSGA